MAGAEENPEEFNVDQALAEYMQHCDSGEMPDREEFLSRHPELREHLSELLIAADWIEQLAGPTAADISGENRAGDGATSPPTMADTITGRAQSPPSRGQNLVGDPDALGDSVEDTLPHFGSLRNQNGTETKLTSETDISSLESSQPILPCQFGDYVLERVLGRGGMGVVYYGRQANLDRPVAIKMIRSGALASEEEVQRFYSEARSAAQLHHPNIVTVYQCGERDGHRYFSMDYVPGTDLSRLTSSGPIDCKTAARYVRDVARAIQFAHDRGILHRDLKPANVLVDENGTVRITDFGLAKSIGKETGITATGAALGTPSYMSPEQAAGRVSDHQQATDIYSLGAILFSLVTGRPPFKAATVVETIMHVIHRPAPTARSIRPDVDENIETIIDVCLQKTPDRRYATASALADDLDRYLNGVPIQARPMSQFRRAWYWMLGVPIVGAILDHRVIEPTEAHRWFQRGMISIALLLLAAWLALIIPDNIYKNRMPKSVKIASGKAGGAYDRLARQLATSLSNNTNCTALAINSDGSNDNLHTLERGEVDLALLQADAFNMLADDSEEAASVVVLAPLFYEAVHVFVRTELELKSLEQLRGHTVNVGSIEAGSHGVAKLLLSSVGMSFDEVEIVTDDWHRLIPDMDRLDAMSNDDNAPASLESVPGVDDETPDTMVTAGSELKEPPAILADAVFVVSQLGSQDVADMLCGGEYELLGIPNAWQFAIDEPSYRPLVITADHYPHCKLPETGIPTVVLTAFLATRIETPGILVRTVLTQLFSTETVTATGIFPAERAAHWQGLAWHPAAREFFQSYRGAKPAE